MCNITHIQWHIGDFLSGVMHMDGAEIGAYTMMIMAHYQIGTDGIPADDKIMMRITRTNPKVWNRIKDIVLEKFTLINGKYVNQRVVDELNKISEKAGPGRGNRSLKDDVGNPKVNDEKTTSDTQVENKSLKNNDSQKTNHNPITNKKEKNKKEKIFTGNSDGDEEDPIWSTHPPEKPNEQKYPAELLAFCRQYPRPETNPYRGLLGLWNMAIIQTTPDELIGAALAYGKTTDDPKFIKSAAKFLEGGFYEQFVERGRQETAQKQETAAMIESLEPWQQAIVEGVGLAKWRAWLGKGPISRYGDVFTFTVIDSNAVQFCENNLHDDVRLSLVKFYKKQITVKFVQE